jgi:hypothetical protein
VGGGVKIKFWKFLKIQIFRIYKKNYVKCSINNHTLPNKTLFMSFQRAARKRFDPAMARMDALYSDEGGGM